MLERKKSRFLYLQKKPKPNCDIRTMFQNMNRKKKRDQHRERNCNRPLALIIIIIIKIFEYLVLPTTLYPLTSIMDCKKRLSSLQYSVFYKSYFIINVKISRIRPLFRRIRRDLISQKIVDLAKTREIREI